LSPIPAWWLVHAGSGAPTATAGRPKSPSRRSCPRWNADLPRDATGRREQSIHHQAGADAPTCATATAPMTSGGGRLHSLVAPAHQASPAPGVTATATGPEYAIPVADRCGLRTASTAADPDQGKPAPPAAAATARTRSCRPRMPRPVNRANIAKTCGSATARSPTSTCRASTARRWKGACRIPPPAPTATAGHEIQRAPRAGRAHLGPAPATRDLRPLPRLGPVMQKYGLAAERVSNVNEATTVWRCAPATRRWQLRELPRRAHILPSSDPRSMVAPANLEKTCGQCHPNVNANFARGKVHLDRRGAARAVDRMVLRITPAHRPW